MRISDCGSDVCSSELSRFQAQLPAPQGQSFAVVAEDPALAGGLEFARYADFVESEMEQLGYTQASSPENATLLVRFDSGIDRGRERGVRTGYREPLARKRAVWGKGGSVRLGHG